MNKYKKFLNQLFCNHSWEMQEKENIHGEAPCICSKCNKYAIINVNLSYRMKPRNYHFCNKCGNDLIRDSYIKSLVDGVYEYKCSRCGELNIVSFNAGICTLDITKSVIEDKNFYTDSMIINIIQKIISTFDEDEFVYIQMFLYVVNKLKTNYYYNEPLEKVINLYNVAMEKMVENRILERANNGICHFINKDIME